MNWLYLALSSIVAPLLLYGIREWVNTVQTRLENLEKQIITEAQARTLIGDKVSPIEDKLEDIKLLLNKLLDIQLKNN
jgi:hypothetical protein